MAAEVTPGLGFGMMLSLAGLGLACRPGSSAGERTANYAEDVAPLIQRRCLPCHGGAASSAATSPPALTDYAEVKSVAEQLLLAVERRRMPPWGADATGLCGEYSDAAWLDKTELATLRDWVRAGTPAGPSGGGSPRTDTPGRPSRAPGAIESGLWLHAPPYAPQLGSRATRCFAFDAPFESPLTLTGLRVEAEPALGVQQLELYALDAPSAARVEMREGADGEPGWPCYGAPRVPEAELVASWAWPRGDQDFPRGTGIELLRTRRFVLLVHYNLVGAGVGSDPVTIRVQLLADARARKARLLPLRALDLRLPAAQARVDIEIEQPLSRSLELLGVVPHLHTLGRTLTLERRHGTERSCLSSFGHWNVYTEQLFRYRAPIELEAGDALHVRCGFDTRSRTEDVRGGPEIDQEECLLYAYVVER